MKRVTLGMGLKKARALYDDLGGQINAADARLAQGQEIDGMIEVNLEAQTNDLPGEPVEVVISSDDMERPEIEDQIIVDIEVTE